MSQAIDRLRKDMQRYRSDPWTGPFWWWNDRTIWMICAFRLAQWAREGRTIPHLAARPIIDALYPLVQAATSIEIWPNTDIGGGLRIHHGGNLVVNPGSSIGENCVLRQGVTIGLRQSGSTDCPTVGDGVSLGAYAQVFGGVMIGDGAQIGAMSVVLSDVPPHATAVGAPAKVVSRPGNFDTT